MAKNPTKTQKATDCRTAKRTAKETGEPVYLPQWDLTYMPDGIQVEGQHVMVDPDAQPEPPPETTTEGRGLEPDFEHDDETDRLLDNVPDTNRLITIFELAANLKVEHGLTDDAALRMAQIARGIEPEQVPQAPTPGAPAAPAMPPGSALMEPVLGPDPALVAAYEERMKTYVAPVLEEKFEITLPARHADYVRQRALWEAGTRRGRLISPEECIVILIKKAKQLDQEMSLALNPGSATGSPEQFNSGTGHWKV